MVKVMKYSVVVLTLVSCVVTVSVTRGDAYVPHARNKRTIGYLFRNLVKTFAPTTQKPAPALPTAQPLKIIPIPASSTQSSVYKKKNYSPTMPAPDSELIKPPIRPLVFPVVSSLAPPVTAYYYQILPSTVGPGDDRSTKSENYVSIADKPARSTEKAPINAQLIIFPFTTASTGGDDGDDDANRDKSYNNNNDNEQVTISRLPLEKRKPVERPPYTYRAEIFVHPRGTSGSRTPPSSHDDDDDDDDDDNDDNDDDDHRSYESKDNTSTDKKKWLEVGDLLNPAEKRNVKKSGDNNVEITREKVVKICSVDENKPLTYNKQEQLGGVNEDVEYLKQSGSRGKEDGEDEEPDASEEKDDRREGGRRLKEVKTEKYRPTGNDDERFDRYRPDPNFGKIVGDFYINFPHSINRGGYDFSVDHGRNNHRQPTDGLFGLDRSFPVSHQKMDQFLPQTIFQNPFLALHHNNGQQQQQQQQQEQQQQQKKTNNYFPYGGANNFGHYDVGKTDNRNPTNNFFPLLSHNLHDFPTTVPYTEDRYLGTTDRSFTEYNSDNNRYKTDQYNRGDHSENDDHQQREADDDESGENGDRKEEDGERDDKQEDEESDDENRKYHYSNDDDSSREEESGEDDDGDDGRGSQSEKVEDSVNEGGKSNEAKTTVQRHVADPPRLPAALHEEVQSNVGRQLQYVQHPPVFDMTADKSEQSNICFNMFGQRIICS